MSHHRDNPNAVQRAFTKRQKELRDGEIFEPPIEAFRAEYEGHFKPFKGFFVEEQFQAYCKRCRLDLDTASPVQVIETRRAFYGAVGQLLVFLKGELADQSEDDGVAELERIWEQVRVFWERQGGK